MTKKSSKKRIRPFNRILIANRGEISIRVTRACSELGITSVAIYSEEDYLSLHRIKADEAYQIGKDKGPVEAYLDIEGIIRLAKNKGIDAIHPGYGFLAENADFAEACIEVDIAFIGPDPESMISMGDKANARKIAKTAGVPVVPGTEGFVNKIEDAKSFAGKFGYPILVKAAFGGGGRGVRVCKNEKELNQNFPEAQSEAKNAFGNDGMIVEKYIKDPKHIEVQILADKYGGIVHLFERDCSIQRRHQKVIEFAPSITISKKMKEALFDSAIKVAKGANYVNAGTVEFLVDNENFYFIEMNTRIQVEHTVTEEITGIDIVRSQIRIAEGYKLSDSEIGIKAQKSIKQNGYAIQCRITTEDPKQNFKPDIGSINDYRSPGGFGIRLDAASAYVGAAITPYYDSMLVKLTTRATEFELAVSKMQRALGEFRIRGLKTNIPFLSNLISHPVFIEGKCKTTFLEKHREIFNIDDRVDVINKLLKFIADVTINRALPKPSSWIGNPPITPVPPVVTESNVPVPEHRKVFKEKGPEGLVKWILNQKKLLITDTTFRDAHQSLLATRMRTYDMLKVARPMAILGKDIFSFEMWGGATFDASMRFLYEDPWDRMISLRKEMPHSMFQMLLRGSNAVGYKNYPDNVVVEFIKKAATYGIDIFRIFDCFNWIPNMKLSIETALKTGKVVEGGICYTGDITDSSRKKYDLKYFVDLAKELKKLDVHIIGIKDMAGLCKPFAAEILVKAIKEETGMPVHFHTHATSGNAEASVLKASEAGADIVDVAFSSLSGGTAQPSLNAIVSAYEGQYRDTGLNIRDLNSISSYWEAVREYYSPFESDMKSSNSDVYLYEIPGGQYTNLRAQAQSLGLANRWEDIKKMYGDVNKLFGDIIKVTPSSKSVGDMALFLIQNNISADEVVEKSNDLSFPESVIDMMKGNLGQPPGGFPENVKKAILKGEESIEDRPGEYIEDIDFKEELEILSKKVAEKVTKKDLISYLLYPNVFLDYYTHNKKYGNVSLLPTKPFYYGMEPGESITVENKEGKSYFIKLFGIGEVEQDGNIPLLFEVNGHPRPVRVKDESVKLPEETRIKADAEDPLEIGAPLSGKVINIFVEKGEEVELDQPLFVIEAMKMQTNIKSNSKGKVNEIFIKGGENVEAGDLVVKLQN